MLWPQRLANHVVQRETPSKVLKAYSFPQGRIDCNENHNHHDNACFNGGFHTCCTCRLNYGQSGHVESSEHDDTDDEWSTHADARTINNQNRMSNAG